MHSDFAAIATGLAILPASMMLFLVGKWLLAPTKPSSAQTNNVLERGTNNKPTYTSYSNSKKDLSSTYKMPTHASVC